MISIHGFGAIPHSWDPKSKNPRWPFWEKVRPPPAPPRDKLIPRKICQKSQISQQIPFHRELLVPNNLKGSHNSLPSVVFRPFPGFGRRKSLPVPCSSSSGMDPRRRHRGMCFVFAWNSAQSCHKSSWIGFNPRSGLGLSANP